MRLTLVAGAFLLSEARSTAPSRPENARTTSVRLEALNVRIGTPIRISKRATVQGGDWNTSTTQQDRLPKVDGADSTSTQSEARDTPTDTDHPSTKAHDPPKTSHPKHTSDGSRVHEYSQHDSKRRSTLSAGFRTPIPSIPAALQEPLASGNH
ncbi:hypothetical protein PGT21_016004 [Puccinia graminis f. sp. tritici]|uniref:Uncharacterized protein n=1 Tax=Puccinia graminis f. sp. tritici TaxID=56615 RepID=A0A5B0NU53_PUCGR|nr:hypothetical protein PGTUg99_009122 [Puccinia graminis f. sp. tritici]KAA1092847.1 hypothetical protein PGT21_016004 [Puccinia graminis f. sp. tritici]